jgi:hypothetical protein
VFFCFPKEGKLVWIQGSRSKSLSKSGIDALSGLILDLHFSKPNRDSRNPCAFSWLIFYACTILPTVLAASFNADRKSRKRSSLSIEPGRNETRWPERQTVPIPDSSCFSSNGGFSAGWSPHWTSFESALHFHILRRQLNIHADI